MNKKEMEQLEKIDAYKRWFENDWTKQGFEDINFTEEEARLFDEEEYRIYRQSPEHYLSGGYFYFQITDLETDEDEQGDLIFKFKLCMIWGVEGEGQDYGEAYFDRTNKKFIYG